MYLPIQKTIEKYLNIGFSDSDIGNDLNQKHVVNFSYLLFCISSFSLLTFFVLIHHPLFALFSFVLMLCGLMAWRYCYIGEFSRAQIAFPFLKSTKVLILCLFFFGENTGFHWLFANIIVYSVVVFRADQARLKFGLVFSSVFFFLICEFFSQRSVALSPLGSSVCIVLVFFKLTFHFTTVITLVMNRLKAVNEYQRNLAEKDELTGLFNRRKVLVEAQKVFSDASLLKSACVFAIVDLDYFKKINDTYGHDVGDLVLKDAASVMQSILRPQDTMGRYGGEEFVVVMRNIHLDQAAIVMERMRKAVEDKCIELGDETITINVSVGVASIDESTVRYEEVLVKADKALYLAKNNGRNRVVTEFDKA